MSATDDFTNYFQEAGVKPAAVQPKHVSAENLSWIREISAQSYRHSKVQLSGTLTAENEPGNVIRLGAPGGTGDAPTDSSLWPQSTLDQRKGRFTIRTLVDRNFTTQEIAMLLMEAYYSKAQVNALLIGKQAVWRLVLMPLTQTGNPVVDAEMVNTLQRIMTQVKHVVPTSANISKALQCTGYVQYIGFDSKHVPTYFLPRIATASGVAMAVGMLGAMFKYNKKKDGTTYMDALSKKFAAFQLPSKRLRVPSLVSWDTISQSFNDNISGHFAGVRQTTQNLYQLNLTIPEQYRPSLSFAKNAWGNVANMIRASSVKGLSDGGWKMGDFVWLSFEAGSPEYSMDQKIPKFEIVKAEQAAQMVTFHNTPLPIGTLNGRNAYKISTLFADRPPVQIWPHDFVLVTQRKLEDHTIPRVKYIRHADLLADGDYPNGLVLSVPEFFCPDPPNTVAANDVVVIDAGLDNEPDTTSHNDGVDGVEADALLVKAADVYKYLVEEGRTGLLLQVPAFSADVQQGDVLTLNGMPLFKASNGAVMAALPMSPDAPYVDAVEVRSTTANKIMRFKRFVGTKHADRAFEAVQYTPNNDETIVLGELPYMAYAADADALTASSMRELIVAVNSESTEDTYKATSTQLSALSQLTQRLTPATADTLRSVITFAGGPHTTSDIFTQPESLRIITHDISPVAWVMSSSRQHITPPPSEVDIASATVWVDKYPKSEVESIPMLAMMIEESMGTKHHELVGLLPKPSNTSAIDLMDV